MAIYTILNIEEVSDILSGYGITNILSHQELSGGSQNSNYVVSCISDEEFVISVSEQHSPEEAHRLVLLLEHLAEQNFSTSRVIKTLDNRYISSWNEKPLMVKKFIKGKVLENIPANIVRLIGLELGKLHKISAPSFLQKSMSFGQENFHEVALYAAGSEYQKWLFDKRQYINSYISDTLPKSFIHSDVFSSNVIISDDEKKVTIMDFEEAAYYYRVYDVGMTIIGCCREGTGINFQKSKSLLEGYQQEIKMTEEEVNSLQAFVVYAATSMSFWRHKNFHYTLPTPSLFDHYKELKNIADTVFEIDSDLFLKLIM